MSSRPRISIRPFDPILSKSRIMKGVQCPKALYLSVRHPELTPPIAASERTAFDHRNRVAQEARKRFPGGVLIDVGAHEQEKALFLTASAIEAGASTLYEAMFEHDGVIVKTDILRRGDRESPWSLIEVKSSTSLKDVHFQDLAIQAWVLRQLGFDVADVRVMHINTACTYPDLSDLFESRDVTDEVGKLTKNMPTVLQRLRRYLSGMDVPEIDLGPQCRAPYPCEYESRCKKEKGVPGVSVFDIPGLSWQNKWRHYELGIVTLDQALSESLVLSTPQRTMIQSTLDRQRFVNRSGLTRAMKEWRYPLYFLDFEAIAPAIPRFPGTHPYQPIPFQFSLHVQQRPGGRVAHYEFLHEDGTDPRETLVQRLLEAIGSDGSVVAYSHSFESDRLAELAKEFPRHALGLEAIRARLVDPLPVLRENVYDPRFRGSFSLKSVAPAIFGEELSYQGMPVSSGTDAQLAFEELVAPATPDDRKKSLRSALLDYCRKDTLAMVMLSDWLRESALLLEVVL